MLIFGPKIENFTHFGHNMNFSVIRYNSRKFYWPDLRPVTFMCLLELKFMQQIHKKVMCQSWKVSTLLPKMTQLPHFWHKKIFFFQAELLREASLTIHDTWQIMQIRPWRNQSMEFQCKSTDWFLGLENISLKFFTGQQFFSSNSKICNFFSLSS